MMYSNYDIHLRATVRFTVIKMEMNWKNMEVSMQILTNYRSSCHRLRNDCFTDFGKIPGKQPRWSPILVQLQALKFY